MKKYFAVIMIAAVLMLSVTCFAEEVYKPSKHNSGTIGTSTQYWRQGYFQTLANAKVQVSNKDWASATGTWTLSTSTNIYGYNIAKGYVVYAKSFTTSASAEVVSYSSVASPGYGAPGKRIKVIAYELIANGTTNVKFQSGGADDIHGSTLVYLTTNSGVAKNIVTINDQPVVYLQTAEGASLSVNLSAGQAVSGTVLYSVE